MTNDKFNDLLALTHVPRWAIIPLTKSQSVAEHTFRVMVIALDITEHVNMAGYEVDYGQLLRWAMDHDGTESKTGDLPTPFKHINYKQVLNQTIEACPWYKSSLLYSSKRVIDIVSLADTIEALMFIKIYGTGSFHEVEIMDDMMNRIIKEAREFNDMRASKRVTEMLLLVGIKIDIGQNYPPSNAPDPKDK